MEVVPLRGAKRQDNPFPINNLEFDPLMHLSVFSYAREKSSSSSFLGLKEKEDFSLSHKIID